MRSLDKKEDSANPTFLDRTMDKAITRAVIMTAAGCLTVFLAGRLPQPRLVGSGGEASASSSEAEITEDTEKTATTIETMENSNDSGLLDRMSLEWRRLLNQPSLRARGTMLRTEGGSYHPSVLKYNLMELSPVQKIPTLEDNVSLQNFKQKLGELYRLAADRLQLPYSKPPESTYGGMFYEELNRKDAEWMSQLYKWIQYTPQEAAERLGLPPSSVEGSYDPTNPEEKSEDPSTWVIPSWKNIKIQFCDGDGRPTTLTSNAKAIASMASVYTYYTGWDDAAAFKSYADQLWKASHSYTVSISDVYDCDGCTEAAEAPSDTTLAANGNIPQGILQNGIEPASDASGADEGSAGDGSAAVDGSMAVNGSGAVDGGAAANRSAAVDRSRATDRGAVVDGGGAADGNTAADAAANLRVAGAGGQTAGAGPAHSASDTNALPEAAVVGQAGALGATDADQQAAAPRTVAAAAQTGASGAAAAVQDTAAQPQLNEEGKFCSGHVDLIITIKINGLTEGNNLFSLAAAEGHDNGQGWPGWNGYTKAYAEQLYAQDWKKEYGLSLAELAFGTPLTSDQITSCMNLLPADISGERKALIAYALSSVGKIPYYYGGKAKVSGYENNQFYAPAPPDKKGRILSGLDCSGWVNWVYWSVTGTEPSAYGTNGLSQAGHEISRDELQPGDIIVRPGTDSHVMMFLGWTDHHSMICVHETGGNTNNVTVSDVNVDWPYYRSLVD